MKHIKVLGLSLAAVLTLMLTAGAQVIAPTGATNRPSSQLVFFYDFDTTNDRGTAIQITNTSVSTPVNIHVQIFQSSNTSPGNPLTAVLCAESNFNDLLTPRDTHVYFFNDEMDLERNDPSNPGPVGISVIDTKGFVVITPIDAPGSRNAIAFQHLFGDSTMRDESLNGFSYRIPAMGRDAVSFSTAAVLPDGTVLDGVSNGYVLLQPEILKTIFFDSGQVTLGDLVSIAFRDNYEGVFGGYAAEPGDAVWTPLIFDEDENPVSCSPVPQNCFFDIGLNGNIGQANNLLGNQVLCPGGTDFGWIKIAVSGLEGLENEMGLWGWGFVEFLKDPISIAGGDWMHAEGPRTVPVPLPECTTDADCAEGEVCEAGECVPAPECIIDADCAEGEVCEVGTCIEEPECTVDADCAEGEVCEAGACVEVDGGGGGCAIASTASAGTTAANALVVLIPLLVVGLRSMLRRREED
ncbi:MAG: hypothetical protein IH874_02710 [Candidatus Dadabacteria bacterium]|nr:hypothetical protein [Candidatus Dadabacteria bacterium]